jgi:hypothetical protein
MTKLIARDGCEAEYYAGQKRPRVCDHGAVFEKPAAPKPRKPMKRSEPKRDWTDARRKVEEEGCCRICKRTDRPLEAAHVLGREHDEPKVVARNLFDGESVTTSKTLYVHPDRIVPLCGPFPSGCHGDIDMRRINVLPYLTLEEQLQAVKDAGSIEAARIRLEPVTHRHEVEGEAG